MPSSRPAQLIAVTAAVLFLNAFPSHGTADAGPDPEDGEDGFELVDRTADLGGNTSKPREAGVAIDRVILHFMSAVNLDADDPFNIDLCLGIFNQYGVSAHYVIGRDGTVYQAVADDRVAYHAGRPDPRFKDRPAFQNMNGRSIGIELLSVGSRRDMTTGTAPMMSRQAYGAFAREHPDWIGYTEQQYVALAALLKELNRRHPAILLDRKHILGHDEYAGARKKDPGELFDWRRIRDAGSE